MLGLAVMQPNKLRAPQATQPAMMLRGAALATQQPDRFERTARVMAQPEPQVAQQKTTGARVAQKLANLMSDAGMLERKQLAAQFLKLTTGIDYTNAVPKFFQLKPEQQAQVQQLARQVQELSPANRVELVKALAGDHSVVARYVDKMLMTDQSPTLKQTRNMLRQNIEQPPQQASPGVALAVGGVAMGLLMLPLVAPAAALVSPAMASRVAAAVGLLLL